jgi:hypothetical protein
MSLLSILILQSTSDEAPPIFVTVGDNHTFSLSSEAQNILRTPSFLILGLGPLNATVHLFNDLIRGRVANPFAPGFFPFGDGTIHQPLEFPFHAEMTLGVLCERFNVRCDPNLANITVVFILSPGSEAELAYEDVTRICAALSSIIPLSIVVMSPPQDSSIDWREIVTPAAREALWAADQGDGGVGVVLCQGTLPGVSNATTDSEYNTERRKEDARYSASLRSVFLRSRVPDECNRSAGFVQPGAVRWPNPYWDFARDLADFIVRLAGDVPPRPLDDSLALFGKAARFVQEQPTGSEAPIPLWKFLHDVARDRVAAVLASLAQKHVDRLKSLLLQGYRALEADPEATAERNETLGTAISEFRRVTDGATPPLREFTALLLFERAILNLKYALATEIPKLVKTRRAELTEEFRTNCSRVSSAVVRERTAKLRFSTRWTPKLEADLMARFSEALHYRDLPAAVQAEWRPIYQYWGKTAAEQLHSRIPWTGTGCAILALAAVLFLASLPFLVLLFFFPDPLPPTKKRSPRTNNPRSVL